MCGLGSAGARASGKIGDDFKSAVKEAAKNATTVPGPLEKKYDDAVIKAVKDGVNFVASPEGTAITTGLLLQLTPFAPAGKAFIFGGAALAGLEYLNKNINVNDKLINDLILETAAVAVTAANPSIGAGIMAGALSDTAENIGEMFGKGAAESAAKGAAAKAKKKD